MKKVKIVFWLLILGFMGLLFYQNQSFFLAKTSLSLDVWIEKYLIPETPNGIYFLACFLLGLLMAYYYHMPERFRTSKAIKHLSATIASLKAEAAATPAATTTVPVSPADSTIGGAGRPPDGGQAPQAAGTSALEPPAVPEKTDQPQSS